MLLISFVLPALKVFEKVVHLTDETFAFGCRCRCFHYLFFEHEFFALKVFILVEASHKVLVLLLFVFWFDRGLITLSILIIVALVTKFVRQAILFALPHLHDSLRKFCIFRIREHPATL